MDKPDTTSDDGILAEARKRYQLAQDADGENHQAALEDLRFISGDHWPEETKRQRSLEGRPCLTINTLPTYLHQVTNDQRQNKPAIKVHPVDDDSDPETAKVFQGLIRHIEYASNADICYDTSVGHAAAIGFGYFRWVTEYEDESSFDQAIRFKRIRNPLSVRTDPMAVEPDGSDMKWCIIESRMTREAFKQEYPDAEACNWPLGIGVSYPGWMDSDFVLVCEYYRIERTKAKACLLSDGTSGFEDELPQVLPPGVTKVKTRDAWRSKVMWYKVTGCDVLDRREILCKWIPVFPVYGDELDIQGKIIRSGLVRNAKDPAMMYDYWMPLSLDTPIPTPNGWSVMGAIKAGDVVFSDTGEPTNVIGTSPTYINRDCYRVTFGDGTHIDADAQHPWIVEVRGKRVSSGYRWKTEKVTTANLDPEQHVITAALPLQADDVELPVHPYMLGMWLGDGHSSGATITAGDEDIEEARNILIELGHEVGLARKYGEKAGVFTVHGGCTALRSTGLLNNKHIPAIYLRASESQRFDLLRGLMDSDGSINNANFGCNYTGSDFQLIGQVRELLSSLGIRSGLCKRAGRVAKMANGSTITSGESFVLSFVPPIETPIFRLKRKCLVQSKPRKRNQRRTRQHLIKSVDRIASVPVKCIAIDAPSHLFLAGTSMIPTHNTSATEEVALRPKTPFIGAVGQFETAKQDWAQANNRSFAFLEYDQVSADGLQAPAPQRQPMADIPSGMLAMAMHASDNIKKTTGLFDASMGAKGTATSGIQEREQQHQGDVANFHYTDNLMRSIRHCGRTLVYSIPKYYDAERTVRILGEDNSADYTTINQPNLEGEKSEDGQVRAILNNVSAGTYDVTISTGPGYSTLRQEAVAGMAANMEKNPALWQIFGDLFIKNQDWPGADEMAERIKRTIPPQILGPQEGDDGEEIIQTAKGPLPASQAAQAIDGMDQHIQQLEQAMQAQQGEAQAVESAKSELQSQKAALDAQKQVMQAEFKAMQAEMGKMKAELGAEVTVQDAADEKVMAEVTAKFRELESSMREMMAEYQRNDAAADAVEPVEQDNTQQLAMMAAMQQMHAEAQQTMQMALEAIANARQPKQISITSPSGQVYTGVSQ